MKTRDASLQEVLGNLQAIFGAEKEIVEETRIIEAGQDALKAQLGRLETLLADVLAGQAELHARLDALEGGNRDLGRLEDLVLRLVARLPLAGLVDSDARPESVN